MVIRHPVVAEAIARYSMPHLFEKTAAGGYAAAGKVALAVLKFLGKQALRGGKATLRGGKHLAKNKYITTPLTVGGTATIFSGVSKGVDHMLLPKELQMKQLADNAAADHAADVQIEANKQILADQEKSHQQILADQEKARQQILADQAKAHQDALVAEEQSADRQRGFLGNLGKSWTSVPGHLSNIGSSPQTAIPGLVSPALQLAGGLWGLKTLGKHLTSDKDKDEKRKGMKPMDYIGPAALLGSGILAGGMRLGQPKPPAS